MSALAILHYHLFKNAGTSLDGILKENVNDKWLTKEFSDIPNQGHKAAVEDWISENPENIAFSSHTATGPLPEVANRKLVSLLFVRSVADRMRSAYYFELKQESDSFGAKLAKTTDFPGYVNARLDIKGDRLVRNCHVFRLASFVIDNEKSELERAIKALNIIDVVGMVEEFALSINVIEATLLPYLPNFAGTVTHRNVNETREKTLKGRNQKARAELGEETWKRLEECNQDDTILLAKAAENLRKKAKELL